MLDGQAVRAIDGQEGASHVRELVVGQVGDADLGVLQPRVPDQPHVGEDEGQAIHQRHGATAHLGQVSGWGVGSGLGLG